MRLSLFSTSILFLTLIAGSPVLACDCLGQEEPERFKRADVVFEGEVALVLLEQVYPQIRAGHVFRVTKTLKGEPVSEIMISYEGFCPTDFNLGGVYRVYADQYEGKLLSQGCSGSRLLYHNTPYFASAPAPVSVWQLSYVKGVVISLFCVLFVLLLRFGRPFRNWA